MRTTGFSLCLILSLVLTACEKPPAAKYVPPKVSVTTAIVMDVPEYEYFSGRTQAADSVDVRARVQGYLKEVRYRDGQEVKQGDTLFIIEQEPYETKLLAAKAQLQQSEAQLKLADANVRRTRQLVQKNAVTAEEADQREADVLVRKAEIALNQQVVRQAEIDYNYTIVKSPISGKAGRHLITPGNLVGVGEETLLTTVVKMDPMEVFFDMPQGMLERLLKRYNTAIREAKELEPPAELELPTESKFSHRGVLNFLDNRIAPETGTIQVRAVFDNAQRLLYEGMFVRVRIPGPKTTDGLLVKEDALSTDLGGKFLLVMGKNNLVERRYIKLGSTYGDMRVASAWDPKTKTGIRRADQYIVNGLLRARPGLPVQPEVVTVQPEHVTEDELATPSTAAPSATDVKTPPVIDRPGDPPTPVGAANSQDIDAKERDKSSVAAPTKKY